MLLVLDNFEHLLDGAELVLKLLKQAQAIKILVTSRQKLNFQAEWLLEVQGLNHPVNGHKGCLQDYSAMRLFVERSSRVKADFSLSKETEAAVTRICQLVEGMPLGLELAAAFVGTHTCQEIATQIEQNLTFLNTSMQDIPRRHRSLQAVLDHSWQLLSVEEMEAIKRLSVFKGPFSLEAALAVAGSLQMSLRPLVNKSLLRQNRTGQYDIHQLLEQYVAGKLTAAPQQEIETRTRHSQYFAQFVCRREQSLKGGQQKKVLAEIGAVIEDVRAAWQWAIRHKDFESIIQAVNGLYVCYWARSWLQEGCDALGQAAEAALDLGRENNLLLAKSWIRQAEFYFWLADYKKTQQLLDDSIKICRRCGAESELALAFEILGRIEYYAGNYAEAGIRFQQSLEICRRIGDDSGAAQALNCLANVICDETADYAQALPFYEESLAIARQIEDRFGEAKVLVNLGAVAQEQQKYAEAQQFYEDSLNIYRELDYRHGQTASLNYLGQIARLEGEYKRAKILLQECLDLNREIGDRRATGNALKQLGDAACEMADCQEARRQYREALRLAVDIQATSFALDVLVSIARLFAQERQNERALELLAFVACYAASGQEIKDRANGLLPQLEKSLSPEVVAVCHKRGKTNTFKSVALELLEYGLV